MMAIQNTLSDKAMDQWARRVARRADTERNQRLFDWAEAVLKALGLDKAVAAARSIEDLRRIALDVDSVADA